MRDWDVIGCRRCKSPSKRTRTFTADFRASTIMPSCWWFLSWRERQPNEWATRLIARPFPFWSVAAHRPAAGHWMLWRVAQVTCYRCATAIGTVSWSKWRHGARACGRSNRSLRIHSFGSTLWATIPRGSLRCASSSQRPASPRHRYCCSEKRVRAKISSRAWCIRGSSGTETGPLGRRLHHAHTRTCEERTVWP